MFRAIVLAGGVGERFWPLSTKTRPKQLLALGGEKSLISQTVERVRNLSGLDGILVITSSGLVKELRSHLAGYPGIQFLGEPVGRNTAPAVALGAALAYKEDKEAITGVFPADHRIGDDEKFRLAIMTALEVAREAEVLVTIGIRPTRAETGYGYVSKSWPIEGKKNVFRVGRFTEKPDLGQAHNFVSSGTYLWNSGIFVWKAETILKSISEHLPDVSVEVEKFLEACDKDMEKAVSSFYQACPSISIDYGVMEKADNVAVVEAGFGWDDLGAWDCVSRLYERDSRGNVVLGEGVTLDVGNCILVSEDGVVAAAGVDDLVIVHTPDATLVCKKEYAQKVREIARAVARKRDE